MFVGVLVSGFIIACFGCWGLWCTGWVLAVVFGVGICVALGLIYLVFLLMVLSFGFLFGYVVIACVVCGLM